MRVNNVTYNVIMCLGPTKVFLRPGVSDIPDNFRPHIQKYLDWGWLEEVRDGSDGAVVVVGREPSVVTSVDPDTIVVGEDKRADSRSSVIIVREDVSEVLTRPKEPEPGTVPQPEPEVGSSVEMPPPNKVLDIDFEKKTKRELNKIASELGIDRPSAISKSNLIEKIKEFELQ